MASQIPVSGQLRYGRASFCLVLVTLFACVPGGPGLEPAPRESASAALLSPPSIAAMGAGDVTIEDAYVWRAQPQTTLIAWVACRGQGNGRACWLLVGRREATRVRALGGQHVGWSVPHLGETADRTQLIVQGDDGRGLWRAVLYYDTNARSVYLGRMLHEDGMM